MISTNESAQLCLHYGGQVWQGPDTDRMPDVSVTGKIAPVLEVAIILQKIFEIYSGFSLVEPRQCLLVIGRELQSDTQ